VNIIHGGYYELFFSTAAGQAVVEDKDAHKADYCAACASAMPVGTRCGDAVLIGKERRMVGDAMASAAVDTIVCDQCDETIVPERCVECRCRPCQCGWGVDESYRPERMAGGGWLQ
jgi:hypothetical protein